MAAYEITGRIKTVMEAMSFPSGFTKREFVIETDEKFPQQVKLGFVKDKCALLDQVKPGEEVKVTFSINGREWQGKYFVDLQAFRLEKLGADSEPETEFAPPPADENFASGSGGSVDDDLPF